MLKVASIVKKAAWTDIVEKAKRLIQSGQVTIMHNSPTHVMAHVIGDHGEYNCEISRTDPETSVIEQWSCECPWDQYAFDRTRKWKHLEGRPCSHVLATYWKGRSTPLDVEGMEPGQPVAPGQKTDATPGQMKIPITEEQADMGELPDLDLTQLRDEITEGAPPAPPSAEDLVKGQPPQSPFGERPKRAEPPKREQLQLFDITAPPGTSPVPIAPIPAVSVPGGAPPTPANPVQFPGTFSHFIPTISIHESSFVHVAADPFEEWVTAVRATGRTPVVQLTKDVTLEARGGKIPMPGAEPKDWTRQGIPVYRTLDLGYDPESGERVPAKTPPMGAPELRHTFADARRGSHAEVIDVEPSLRMAYVIVPLHQTGPLHPHLLAGWVDYSDLRPLPDATTPFRTKR